MGKKVYVDLTHPFSAEIPRWPYFDKPEITNAHTMAKGGVLTSKITCTMHTGTHCDAPRHVMEYEFDGRRARYTHEMPIDAYTGEAVVLKLDVEPWTLITDKHLDEACKKCGIDPASLKGKVLCLNTGMHRLFDDSKAYYHYSIGTGIDAGKWFVKHGVKCVAMDSQALDHPLHTAMGNNGMTRMNLLQAHHRGVQGAVRRGGLCRVRQVRVHPHPRPGRLRREVRRAGGSGRMGHLGALPQGDAGPRHRGR